MDWTSRTPFQWDWETLALFSVQETEISNPPEEPKSISESGIRMATGSVYSRGMVECSSSEAGDCPFQSSISASVASSSKSTMTAPDINFKFEEFLNNQNRKRGLALVDNSETSEEILSAEGVKEPLIGLKLGRRMYFEDPCVGNFTKDSSSSASITSSTTSLKKSKVYQQNMLSAYCQVEGCKVDLTTAKDYHRKHRVCERHSKFPKVVVAGQERRFCQQCSRFHSLSEFDQKKRSCRRRLSDHNARRRKPQQETFTFSSSKLTPSDDKEYSNIVFSQAPFSHMTTRESSICDASDSFKLTQTDGSWIKSCKIGRVNGQAFFPSSYGRDDNGSTDSHDLGKPLRSTVAEVPNQGLRASVALNWDGARNLQRAFSLLSTDSHLPPNTGTASSEQFVYANNNNGANPAMHSLNAKRSVWQAEQPLPTTSPFNSKGNGALLQEYLVFKTSYGTGFFDSNHLG